MTYDSHFDHHSEDYNPEYMTAYYQDEMERLFDEAVDNLLND